MGVPAVNKQTAIIFFFKIRFGKKPFSLYIYMQGFHWNCTKKISTKKGEKSKRFSC